MRLASLFPMAALIAVVSCSDGTVTAGPAGPEALTPAAATTFTENEIIPIDLLVFIPCADGGAGEFVELSGNLHVLFHSTINGNHFVLKSHFQPQGIRGLGQSTGASYRATGVTQDIQSGSFVNGQFSFTLINNFRIIGQGRGNNLLVHETFHVTFNANGELTAFVDNFSVECK